MGVELDTGFGRARVDVIEVDARADARSLEVADDRLYSMSHLWAIETASSLQVAVMDGASELVRIAALVAEPGPLVAMKLQSVQNRGSAKEGTDLLDIVRLTTDRESGIDVRTQLAKVDATIASDCAEFIHRVLLANPARSLSKIRAAGGDDITVEDIEDVAAILLEACKR